MTGIDLTIELGGTLEPVLNRAIAREDMTGAMADIADVLVDGARRSFDYEQSPLGVPWKKSYRAYEDGGKTLTLSGLLKSALVPDYGRDFAAAGVLRTAGPAKYARIHQRGGEILPKVKKALSFAGRLFSRVVMPARPYLGFGHFERDETIDILTDRLIHLFADGAST